MKERFKAPFTTIAEDLFKGLREGLIEELLVISSFTYEGEDYKSVGKKKKICIWTCQAHNEKTYKFTKTFYQFPNVNYELTELRKNKEGKYMPRRWQRIKQLLPDFDIYIDDKSDYILEAHESR